MPNRPKYPPQTCRDCRWARWTYSDKEYSEGKKRIIVQQPGACLAQQSKAGTGSMKRPLDARHPYLDCQSWQQKS